MKKLYSLGLIDFIVSVAVFWFGLHDWIGSKVVFVRDFIVDCAVSVFVLPKTKIPILLSNSQVAMKSYYKKFGRFQGTSVVNMSGHFIAKKAVNGIA